MSVVNHQLDIYGVWLHLALTRHEWATLRRRHAKLPPIASYGLSSLVQDDDDAHLCLYVAADKLAGNPQGLTEILAHEAAHGAGMILDFIDQEYDGQSEAHAYLVGYLAAWMWGHVSDRHAATGG